MVFAPKLKALALCAGLMLGLSATASAQISEVRVGITEYDADTIDIGWAARDGVENSLALNGEVIFAPLGLTDGWLDPRPYVGAMINLEGETSYIGAGLTWRAALSEKFYGDIAIGLALHNGTIDVITPDSIREQGFAVLARRIDNEISHGSAVLFKPQLTLGYRVTDDWAVEVFAEHMSNGFLKKPNEGVDSLGLRVARRF